MPVPDAANLHAQAVKMAAHVPIPQQPVSARTVLTWELRRVAANRSTWIASGLALLFFLLIVVLLRDSQELIYNYAQFNSVRVAGTSAWGMAITVPKYLLLVLGILLPFVAAEGAARDFRRRTHELLLATRVPGWVFILGRYAAVLVLSIGLALVMLAAILAASLALYIWRSYPLPNVPAILALWTLAVLPAAILVSGVSFALGTLLPRHANGVKTVLLVAWVLSQFAAALWETEQSPYAVIDPAGVVMSQVIQGPYAVAWTNRSTSVLSRAQALQTVREVEQMMPDLWPWVAPRLIYAGIGLASVGVAAARFKRFRDA